jgi:hypothetical protein
MNHVGAAAAGCPAERSSAFRNGWCNRPKSAMFNMFNMPRIRLEPELEEKLDSLAKETGRSKNYSSGHSAIPGRPRRLPEGNCRAGAPRTHHHTRRAGAQAWSGRLPGPLQGRSKSSTVQPKSSSFVFWVSGSNPLRIDGSGVSLFMATNRGFGVPRWRLPFNL